MGSFRKPARTSILVLTSFVFQQAIPLALLWTPSALSDTTTATTTATTASPFSSLGSNFSGAGNPGITANFNSCMSSTPDSSFGAGGGNQVQQMLNASKVTINPDGSTSGGAGGKGGKGGKAGAPGANGPNCGNPAIPDASSLSCTSNMLVDPGTQSFSKEKADKYLQTELQGTDEAALTCKKNQLDSASNELGCIAKQGQLLAQQIGSLSSVYQANINRFQQDDQTYKQRIGDRTSQISQINALLNGDGGTTDANGNAVAGSGKKGLLQIAAQLKTLTETTLPAAVSAAQNTAQTFSNTGNTITQNIQYRTMSLIGNCFKNQPVNGQGYNCTPNGPNVSAMQFLECRYQQYAHVQGGTYDIRSSTNQQATSAQMNLDAIFQQMFSNTPMSWTLPTDQSGSQAASTASYTATNLAGAESQYISQLSGITVNGVNLATEANQLLAVCQAQATSAVANEQTSPSSYLGQSIEALYQQGTTNNSNFSSTIQQNANAWTDAMTVLSSQNLPLNLVGCQPNYNSCVSQCTGTNTITMTSVPSVSCVSTCGQTSSAQQVSCLNQLQTQINGLYQGSGSQPAFTMNVTSQFPDTAIPASALQCKGINGCIALLQQRSKEVGTAKTQLQTAETSYVQQARQSTAQFTTQLSQLLGSQSSALRSKMDSLNQTLRSLGISKVSSQPIQPAELDYDTGDNGQPGLPKMPTNMLGLIGGHMTPPMPDVTDPNFADADGFQDAESKVEDSQNRLTAAVSEIQSLESSCDTANKKADVTLMKQLLTPFDGQKCNAVCPELKTSLGTLSTDLARAISKSLPKESASLFSEIKAILASCGTGTTTSAQPDCSNAQSAASDACTGTAYDPLKCQAAQGVLSTCTTTLSTAQQCAQEITDFNSQKDSIVDDLKGGTTSNSAE